MKIANIFFLLTSFIVVTFNTGCNKPVYNKLDEDQVKFLVYNQSDFIIFKSSGVLVDTFYVDSRARGYAVEKPHYNEVASILFHCINDTLKQGTIGNITVSKNKSDDFEASYVFPHFPDKVILSDMVPVPVDTINGLPVENVYISEADSISFSTINHVRKVYYTKEAGFLKFEDIYGNSWYKIN